ncbi:MAG: enoyl-CoA hydratase-related protein [Candidatus Muiribacteriota bacterium]
MELKNFLLEEKGNLFILTINKPDTLNSLSTEVLKEFYFVLDSLYKNNKCRVLIITGVKKAFVAGADISEMKDMNKEQAVEFSRIGHKAFSKLQNAPFISIAAVNGFALGGGMELACACDLIYASTNAKFGQPETGLGIIPGFGATQRISRLCGLLKARELIFTGKIIKSQQAFEMGIVNDIFESEELIEKVLKIAKTILSKSFNALKLAKISINTGYDKELDKALEMEQDIFGTCFQHSDQKEGMSAFINKKTPEFK